MSGIGGRQPAKNATRRPCVVCGVEFQPYRANATTCSVVCYRRSPARREAMAAIKVRPEVKARKNAARRVAANPDKNRGRNLRSLLRVRYGLTVEQYQERLADQGGVCHLCGAAPSGGVKATARLHVDHDHTTGTVRMLLCNGCNRGLGYLKDDPDLMERAAAYVRSYRT